MSYAKLHTPDDDDDVMCHWKAQIPAADHEIHDRHSLQRHDSDSMLAMARTS